MTEEEAKTKWCPNVRVTTLDEKIASNRGRYVRNDDDTNCIGSACMVWRLFGGYEEQTHATGLPPLPLANEGWAVHEVGTYVTTYRRPRMDGFCGLAGKP